jgi:hypothetical protein
VAAPREKVVSWVAKDAWPYNIRDAESSDGIWQSDGRYAGRRRRVNAGLNSLVTPYGSISQLPSLCFVRIGSLRQTALGIMYK